MDIQIVRTLAEWDALYEVWDVLLVESTFDVPFLRHGYLRTWWDHRGGGEWLEAELYILIAREGDKLVGIAPMFEAGERLYLLGSVEISDYLDVIVRREDLSGFLTAVLAHLEKDARRVEWVNLPEDSPTLEVLPGLASACGWACSVERYLPSPVVVLPDDWEMYLGGLKKKQRGEIRRKIKRLENGEAAVHWYIVEDGGALDAEMDAFLDLMAHDPMKAKFLSPQMRAQMKATSKTMFDNGWLQLAFLEIGGEKAAAYLNFDYGNRIYLYNSGVDPKFRQLSVGWVLLAYTIRWAAEHGREAFDFLRGDEDYKYRFGGVDRWVMRVNLTR